MYSGNKVECDGCSADGGPIEEFFYYCLKSSRPQFHWEFIVDVVSSSDPYHFQNDLHYCPDCKLSKCHRDARGTCVVSKLTA